jgi:hypothetical protein
MHSLNFELEYWLLNYSERWKWVIHRDITIFLFLVQLIYMIYELLYFQTCYFDF